MIRWFTLSLALFLLACQGSPSTAPKREDSKASAQPPISERPPASPPLPHTQASAPPTEAASEPAPPAAPKPLPSFKEAMVAIASCERDEGGLLLADPKVCLRAVKAARQTLLTTSKGTEEQRIQELAEQLTELLAHNDPSVVFYALSEARGDFRSSPQTLKALEGLMASPIEALSEAAAKTRFTLRGASEAQTLKLALARFARDPLRRVRHAACQHLGSRQYKGKRDVFNVLLEAAKREDEEALIRGCAARELGNIATDRDIKALIALLHYPEIQQATVTALQRGLATPKAIDAYVRWFERFATQASKIHWTSLHAFLPWDTELHRMPRERSVRTLERIAGHREHTLKVRTLAVAALKRLKAERALKALREALPADAAPELKQALGS